MVAALYDQDNQTDPEDVRRLTSSIPIILEGIGVVFLLLLFSNALIPPLLTDETRPEGSPILRLMWLPLYGIIFLVGMYRIIPLINLTVRLPLIIMLMGVIAASTFWSIDQGLTFRRFIAIGMTTVFGLHMASRYTWREVLTLLGVTWIILCIGSFIFSLGVPSLGVEQFEHAGAWKGLWFQKNALGGHMARASFLFAFLLIVDRHLRGMWSVGLVMSIALVLLSTSATALLGMMVGFLTLMTGLIMRRGAIQSLTVFWLAVTLGSVFAIVFATNPDAIFGLLGRDATLTGRTDIWEALFDVIEQRPNRGFGYGAFWSEGSLQALYVREITQWEVPTAHNGWLETWLGIGLIGLVIFSLSFVFTTIRAAITAFSDWYGFFALGYILQFIVFSLSESNILQQNSIDWLTYAAIAGLLVQKNLGRSPIKLLGPRRNRDFLTAD